MSARSILDLGSGTGETARAALAVHPAARLIGVDSSEDMLSIARQQVASGQFLVGRLEDPLPPGPFDVVVSAFAVHHLDGTAKADLFRRLAKVMVPGGRFAMLDVVIPTEPVDHPIRLEEGVDRPSAVADMLEWLADAGFIAHIAFSEGDLAILAATATERRS